MEPTLPNTHVAAMLITTGGDAGTAANTATTTATARAAARTASRRAADHDPKTQDAKP